MVDPKGIDGSVQYNWSNLVGGLDTIKIDTDADAMKAGKGIICRGFRIWDPVERGDVTGMPLMVRSGTEMVPSEKAAFDGGTLHLPQETRTLSIILYPAYRTVPDLVGLTEAQALQALDSVHLNAEPHGSGTVASQSPPAGARVEMHNLVQFWSE